MAMPTARSPLMHRRRAIPCVQHSTAQSMDVLYVICVCTHDLTAGTVVAIGQPHGILSHEPSYSFFFASAALSTASRFARSSARRRSLRSRPRVTIALGSRSARKCLHTTSTIHDPAKSISIARVSLNWNCVRLGVGGCTLLDFSNPSSGTLRPDLRC